MAKKSGIAWTDHTFNGWWGCTKVSPACDNCYAEVVDGRFSEESHWGSDAPRRFFGDKHWNEPLRWNREAQRTGQRTLVFAFSMSDFLEKRADLDPWRLKLWGLISMTPDLTWLMLTKRPQDIARVVPAQIREARNVWWGTTIESPDYLWRADALIENASDAPVRFVSMEPLLAETSIADALDPCAAPCGETSATINWVITGCESGTGARDTPTDWYRKLFEECSEYRVPRFLKQAPLGAEGITEGPGSFRKQDRRKGTDGMTRVHTLIEKPYLDGEQYTEFPT